MGGAASDISGNVSGGDKINEKVVAEQKTIAEINLETARINANIAKEGKRLIHPESWTPWVVLAVTIFSAAGLMVAALIVEVVDKNLLNATKDVLPLATALVGFAGGAVTTLFGKEAAVNAAVTAKLIPESGKQ